MNGLRLGKERSELVAAAAVAHALRAKLIRRDLPGTRQTRDFDLVFPAGSREPEPLEVTTFASRPDLETWQRLERDGEVVHAPELNHVWYLDVGRPIDATSRTETLDVRRIRREVVQALVTLESGGHTQIEYGQIDRDALATPALRQLLALGVDAGHAARLFEGDTGRVELIAPVGGFSHPDSVASGIESEAGKTDNQKKLTEPPNALRRHLVVVFDSSSGTAFINVHLAAKGRLPQLPNPITTAWAFASNSLLGTTPPDAWENHRIPQWVFDAPEDWLCVS